MNNRTLSGISVCVTYALVSGLCVFIALSGLVPLPGVQRLLLNLPIRLQIVVADAIGLGPFLNWLFEEVHWSAPYAALLVPTFCVLYRIGWWIERLDEEIREPAAPRSTALAGPADRAPQRHPDLEAAHDLAPPAVAQVEQLGDGAGRHLAPGNAHRCQRRRRVRRAGGVVVADHRDVARHMDAGFVEAGDGAEGHLVVGAEQRGEAGP